MERWIGHRRVVRRSEANFEIPVLFSYFPALAPCSVRAVRNLDCPFLPPCPERTCPAHQEDFQIVIFHGEGHCQFQKQTRDRWYNATTADLAVEIVQQKCSWKHADVLFVSRQMEMRIPDTIPPLLACLDLLKLPDMIIEFHSLDENPLPKSRGLAELLTVIETLWGECHFAGR